MYVVLRGFRLRFRSALFSPYLSLLSGSSTGLKFGLSARAAA